MENIINGALELLCKQYESGDAMCFGKPFSTYQKVYFSTNENIKDYIDKSDLKSKSNAISVMASGDHVFNLIEKGILNIDTFDTNTLTEYYVLGLKCSMILKYSYKEYLININKLIDNKTSLLEITSMLNDLLPFMDLKYRKFWKKVIDYNYLMQNKNGTNINLFSLLFINIISSNKLIERNNYLKDNETYNSFKNNLIKSNISFKNVNAIDLSKYFNSKYDVILLSNIFDYLKKYFDLANNNDIKQYINELYTLMSDDGKLFLIYIFDYASKNYTRRNITNNLTLDDFDNYDVISVNSSRRKNVKDGVLVLKNK